MRLSVLVTPISDTNLKLVAQAGATDIVIPYPGLDLEELLETKKRIESFGLKVSVIERLIPHMKFVHNLPGRDQQIEDFKTLIRNLGKAGIPILSYNWMPDDDWQRTVFDMEERGGAAVTGFDLDAPSQVPTDTGYDIPIHSGHVTEADQLWENLEYFLQQVVPVAEEAGVTLAIHPDDPPLPVLRGQPRIIIDVESYERVVSLYDSPRNKICFCQGTMATRDDTDIPEAIARLAPHIAYIHYRDVVGNPRKFRETFIDNGKTDMGAAMQAYLDAGLPEDVPIRPDHVPTLETESDDHPGYQTLGRLHALGYMRGVMDGCGARQAD